MYECVYFHRALYEQTEHLVECLKEQQKTNSNKHINKLHRWM